MLVGLERGEAGGGLVGGDRRGGVSGGRVSGGGDEPGKNGLT